MNSVPDPTCAQSPPTACQVQLHRSPGLTAVYNELKTSLRNRILDLGSPSAGSFKFFSQLGCSIHFEGIDLLLTESAGESATCQQQLEPELSRLDPEKHFDVILAWDLFNYLDTDTIAWLMKRLSQHCHANTLVHFLRYTSQRIPAKPRHCQIIDQYRVALHSDRPVGPRKYQPLNTTDTLRCMPDHSLDGSYVNHHGMALGVSEHVLRYRPTQRAGNRQLACAELSAAPYTASQGGALHHSHGLAHICQVLRQNPNSTVLDLGGKSGRNGDFLLQYAERVYRDDLVPSLLPDTGEDSAGLMNHALKFEADLKFDVILAWDIFNFCSQQQILTIRERLRPHLKPNSLLFAITYSGADRPHSPQQFRIVDNQRVSITANKKASVTEFPFTTASLLKALGEFRLAKTYILQPGMKRGVYEYLFTNDGKNSMEWERDQ
ncbi:hypothetical protein [Marinimicrobium sp. ABcell2]|uniref:hypothetical protein n=1 Tax=Marinimicrobium sp. ABcell2 TaxID=3069751 RepID=UPI0027B4E506|nr:hypothetical protein [Marinimicrobium sp. ABcell2]MDQ2075850.1 hypothetical protein [Marinimicrobium sp. ABcell2]